MPGPPWRSSRATSSPTERPSRPGSAATRFLPLVRTTEGLLVQKSPADQTWYYVTSEGFGLALGPRADEAAPANALTPSVLANDTGKMAYSALGGGAYVPRDRGVGEAVTLSDIEAAQAAFRCQRPRRAVGGADRDVASADHHRHRVREPGGPRRRGRAEGRRRQRRRELERRRSALPRRLRLEQAALQRREQHHQLLRNHVERQVLLDAGDRGDQRVRHGRQHQPARQGGRRRDPRDAQARPRQLGISRIPERRGQGPARRVRRRAQRSLPVHRLRDLRYEPQRRARTDRGGAAVHRGGLRSLRGRRHTVNLGLPMGAVQHGQRQLRTRRNRQPPKRAAKSRSTTTSP